MFNSEKLDNDLRYVNTYKGTVTQETPEFFLALDNVLAYAQVCRTDQKLIEMEADFAAEEHDENIMDQS